MNPHLAFAKRPGPAGLSSRAAAPGWSALRGCVNGSAGGLGKGQLQGGGKNLGGKEVPSGNLT
jgi:hypothetical protein